MKRMTVYKSLTEKEEEKIVESLLASTKMTVLTKKYKVSTGVVLLAAKNKIIELKNDIEELRLDKSKKKLTPYNFYKEFSDDIEITVYPSSIAVYKNGVFQKPETDKSKIYEYFKDNFTLIN